MGNDFQILENILGKFSTISLEEMDSVQLMNRVDTKYIFDVGRLSGLLENALKSYRMLCFNDVRICNYNSLYYDTADLRTYLDHHNGIRPRHKVRFREYVDTGNIFLEVKRKVSTDRTSKSRIGVKSIEQVLSSTSVEYITDKSPLDPVQLQPALWSTFRRITLVRIGKPERITIDIDLSFRHDDREENLPFLCICEVKREAASGITEFMKIMKNHHIHSISSSKYCIGTLLLKDGVKYNNFKSLMLFINKTENVYRSSISTS